MKLSARTFIILFSASFFSACQTFERSDSGGSLQKSTSDVSNLVTSTSVSGLKQRLLILPLLGEEPKYTSDFKDRAMNAFRMEIQNQGAVIALSSRDLKIDVEKYHSESGYQLKEMSAEARKAGAAGILEASIVDFRVKNTSDSVGLIRNVSTDFEAQIRVRILHLKQGKEVFNTTKTVQFRDQNIRVAERVSGDRFIAKNPEMAAVIIKDALLEFVPQITGLFQNQDVDWQGRVASLQGDRIYLNVGQVSGIQLGDVLKVSDEGEEVFDPQTGILIGEAPGRIKGTVEVISYFGKDGAIAIIHSGAGIKENDRVLPY